MSKKETIVASVAAVILLLIVIVGLSVAYQEQRKGEAWSKTARACLQICSVAKDTSQCMALW